jgi:hypothetical protein
MLPISDSAIEWTSSEEFWFSEPAFALTEYADEDPYFPDPYSRF